MEVAHPTQLPESSLRTQGRPARGRKRNLLGWYSLSLLFGYVFGNTLLSYEEGGTIRQETFSQLMLFLVFCFLWFRHVGLTLDRAVFGWLALLPAVLAEGAGYIFVPGMALTPADLLGVIGLLIWFRNGYPIRLTRFTRMAWVLLGVCMVSVVLTLNPDYTGQVLRLVLQVLLVTAIFSAPGTASTKAFVDGICAWPVVALAYLWGAGKAVRFFSFGSGNALDVQGTGEVLYGSHLVVMYFLPLISLVLAKNPNGFIILCENQSLPKKIKKTLQKYCHRFFFYQIPRFFQKNIKSKGFHECLILRQLFSKTKFKNCFIFKISARYVLCTSAHKKWAKLNRFHFKFYGNSVSTRFYGFTSNFIKIFKKALLVAQFFSLFGYSIEFILPKILPTKLVKRKENLGLRGMINAGDGQFIHE